MMKCRKIKLGFFSVLLTLTLIIYSPQYFPPLFFSVLFHELGHIVTAHFLKINLRELKIGIFGASLSCSDTLYSYKKEIILCIAGPITNFLTVLIVYTALGFTGHTEFFILSSLSLGILNMFPINGFDGGRIFSALLLIFLPPKLSTVITKIVSFIFIFSLWCMSVYLLLRITSSLSLFVFCLSLFAKIFLSDSV